MQGLGDSLLGKENSLYETKRLSRDSHSSVWVCSHPCISGMPWPGCRKEAHSLRSVGMQGVLWLLPDELPEDLRDSPKLVSPSVPEDEEHLPQGRLAWMKSAAQDIEHGHFL